VPYDIVGAKIFRARIGQRGNSNKPRGIKDDPVGSVDSKTEIVAARQEKIDIDSARLEPLRTRRRLSSRRGD
jgi:hypothetical protein